MNLGSIFSGLLTVVEHDAAEVILPIVLKASQTIAASPTPLTVAAQAASVGAQVMAAVPALQAEITGQLFSTISAALALELAKVTPAASLGANIVTSSPAH